MRVTHDRSGNFLSNTGELYVCQKATFSTDLSCQKQPLKMINAI